MTLPPRKPGTDESVAAYVLHRLANAVEQLVAHKPDPAVQEDLSLLGIGKPPGA